MKITKKEAAQNRADVLGAAGQTIREHGIEKASISNIAQKAGLTHGAVYRHFQSKTRLVGAAIEADFDTIVAMLDQTRENGQGIRSYLDIYLQEDHRDHFPWGCPAAPLASEIMRTEPEIQTAFMNGLRKNLDAVEKLLGPDAGQGNRARAMTILASLVGAMALARATKAVDPALSRDFLNAVKDGLLTALPKP